MKAEQADGAGPQATPGGAWYRPMVARPTDEEHRSATVLELFFDLCFVVAVAQAASALHHADRRGPRRRRRGRLRHGVLRHLVGVDELHLVRLGLRHRRRRLPADHPRPDRRRPDPGRRRARRHGRQRLRRHHPRLRGHAPGHGRPVAAGGRRRPAPPAQLAALRRRHRRSCRSAGCCGWPCPSGLGMAGFLVLVAAELAVPIWAERAAADHLAPAATSPSATACSP